MGGEETGDAELEIVCKDDQRNFSVRSAETWTSCY